MMDDWYKRQSEGVQAAMDTALAFLAQRERNDWRRPEFDLLSGDLREIGEIRFKVDKQYRIFGFFGPNKSEFTLLAGSSKKGKNYDPINVCETALERMKQIKADGSRCCVCDF
jgi:hypothetical protein